MPRRARDPRPRSRPASRRSPAALQAADPADRVGFPADYRGFAVLRAANITQQKRLGTIYANVPAASIHDVAKLPYPNGSVIVMEWATPRKAADGTPVTGADGLWKKGEVVRLDVMRREAGYGAAYGDKRAGEWEFASYEPTAAVRAEDRRRGLRRLPQPSRAPRATSSSAAASRRSTRCSGVRVGDVPGPHHFAADAPRPGPLLADGLAVLRAFDAGVQRAGVVEPVEDPLREVVRRVGEHDAARPALDQREAGRRLAARLRDVGDAVRARFDPQELERHHPRRAGAGRDVLVQADQRAAGGRRPDFLHLQRPVGPGPVPLQPGKICNLSRPLALSRAPS